MEDKVLTEQGQLCLQELLRIWFDFERNLGQVDIIRRLDHGRFSRDDYLKLLLNLRQQVIEGSRWISRGASSFDRNFADVRSLVIGHATEEHRDYEILERDYVSAGGQLNDIQNYPRNVGSEALHGFLMYRASQTNPVDLIGAMWIIEGLGQKMASNWAKRIQELTDLDDQALSFMSYHGENDEDHLGKLYSLIDRVCENAENQRLIVRTARVVARLYLLQLEEIDNE
jgi:hypothetical protein